ncbi:hypothetical protein BS78_03G328200 [Paspalum vaginatum]|nr:hypothetical protein BS78_03G328200 [Paspalum vaginatum]
MDSINQNSVYYDPQRDVLVSGATQSVSNSESHIAPSASSHMPYSTSVQQDYNAAQYPNHYFNYPQAANDSSVQQGVDQSPGAAYQPLASFQNSGSYVGPTSNKSYNAGAHQTVPGYGTSNYYYHQNNAWGDGSSVNNHVQSYQSYTPDSNVAQSSSSLPTSSVHHQKQYNQWPYYYNQSAQTSGGLAVTGSTASDTKAGTVCPDFAHSSNQPPPPGTTSWKGDAGITIAPPPQAPAIQGYQNQYTPQAPVTPVFHNPYVNNTASIPTFQKQYVSSAYQQRSANHNQLLLSNQVDQQKALNLHGSSSNVSSVSHVSENSQTSWQDSVTSNVHRVNKIQTPTNPRIAPDFPIGIPKADKLNLEPDSSLKPAYVCVSMTKSDEKATQGGSEAAMQGSFPVSLRTYVEWNLAHCKDDAQRTASQSILKEIITKATADGTLHTKNWDIEPLFSLPENATGPTTTSTGKDSSPFSFSSSRRSPSRRTKSRWEPVTEETVVNNVEVPKLSVKNSISSILEPTKRMSHNQDMRKFVQSCHAPLSQCSQSTNKKQRTVADASLTENGNASSDSDKEQGLTKYYASSIALANSSEEKKRREHRSKRFEQSQGAPSKSRSSIPDKDNTAHYTVQSCHAPLSQCSQSTNKKQRTVADASLTENGNASSDSDKEQGLTKYYASSIALANSSEEKKRREHRSKRFEQSQGAPSKSRSSIPDKDNTAHYTRRSMSLLLNRSCDDGAGLAVEDLDWDALTIKGTCQEIEKRYLRLTRAPDRATVRPEDVLEKALRMVETSEKNYLYKCDQLKSIRQDLTVQRIQNELTVKVYETHARLAIQCGDLPEYNQCQSQLKRLYGVVKGCNFELSAYNLLCVMLHSNNKRDLLSSMASLPKEAKKDAAVKHALEVHSAVSSGNYVLFFKLYKMAPNLNSYLMDLYVERMRFEAIKCICKSYRPTVPVRYAARVLGFVGINDGADGVEECEEWLKAHGAVLLVDNNGELQIDTKVSSTSLSMPEPENAVSHGDASLAVDDFLARAS